MATIFALSTPPGRSGVAVVRISGLQALASARALGVTAPLPARTATLTALRVGGTLLDRALVLYFPAPHSFTGEDVVEFHIHGGRAVIRGLLDALAAIPRLRAAEPGEFTRRAFLNGKMDLTAAEGLADLIDAETEAQRKQALRLLQGEAADFYRNLRGGIVQTLALMEAYIDFPDEDIPESVLRETDEKVQSVARLIKVQLSDAGVAERIREGVQVAIVGPPNAGKSSLMNLLARRDVAIVSEVAGTTRDVIEVHLDMGGYAVTVADTAGIRESDDSVEREGIRRSLARADMSDIRIVVLDAASGDHSVPRQWMEENTLFVLNKIDLRPDSPLPVFGTFTPIPFSARTRDGLEDLMRELEGRIAEVFPVEASFVTRGRHRHHLNAALAHLEGFRRQANAALELRCEELRRAASEIGRITGVIMPDEILGEIFSRFCIGK